MKLLKIAFWILMVLLVIAVGGVVVVTQTVDPNDYKPQIQKLVKDRTGRDINLEGELNLTFFPWVGVETGRVVLDAAEGFGPDPMLAVDNAQVRVKLLPLIKREVEVDTVVLDAPTVRLATNEAGVNSWDDLVPASDPAAPADNQEPAAIAALAVQGVSIKDGSVDWENAQSGQSLSLRALNLDTGTLVPGEPLEVSLSVDASGSLLPEPGSAAITTTITLGEQMAQVALATTSLEVDAESLAATMSFNGATYALDQQRLQLDELDATITRDDKEATIDITSLVADLTAMSVDLPAASIKRGDDEISLSIEASGTDPATREMRGDASFAIADVRALLAEFGQGALLDGITDAALRDLKGGLKLQMAGPQISAQEVAMDVQVNELPTSLRADTVDYHLGSGAVALPALSLSQSDVSLELTLNGKGLTSPGAERTANGSVALKVPDVAALVERNGVQAALPELPISDIDIASNFKLEGNLLSASRLATRVAYQQNPTTIAADRVAFNIENGALEVSSLAVEQEETSARASVSGSNTLGGVASMQLAGDLQFQTPDVPRLLARNGIDVELPEGLVSDATASAGFSLKENTLALSALDVNAAGSRIEGEARIVNLDAPAYRFDLRVDQLDVDRLTAAGTTAGEAQPSTAEQVLLPVAPLRGLNVDGRARIGQLITTGMTLTDVDATIKADENVLRVTPMKANLFGGSLESNLRYDVSGDSPAIDTSNTVQGVDIGALLGALEVTDKIAGTGNLNADLRGRGVDVDQFVASLAGDIGFNLRDGAIKGYDLQAALLEVERAYASFAGQSTEATTQPEAETRFAELSGTFDANKGVFRNDDLSMKAPAFRLGGGGEIRLPDNRIDYKLDVNVVKTVEGQGGASLDELENARIPLKIYGSLTDPTITLDLASLLKEQAKKEIKKQILKELLPDAVDQPSGATTNGSAQEAPAQEAPPKDPEESLEDALKEELKKGLLKGLGF